MPTLSMGDGLGPSHKHATVTSPRNTCQHTDLQGLVVAQPSWYRDAVHVVVDYRPALRARTGIGEYVHELARAIRCTAPADESLTLLSSSWTDRVPSSIGTELPGAAVVDL